MLRRNGWHGISGFCYALDIFAMNLWLLKNETVEGYDTFDSAVVAAPDAETARMIHPLYRIDEWDGKAGKYPCWCDAADVIVQHIGTAALFVATGVVCASFNAG